jgi:hypothetical protein
VIDERTNNLLRLRPEELELVSGGVVLQHEPTHAGPRHTVCFIMDNPGEDLRMDCYRLDF